MALLSLLGKQPSECVFSHLRHRSCAARSGGGGGRVKHRNLQTYLALTSGLCFVRAKTLETQGSAFIPSVGGYFQNTRQTVLQVEEVNRHHLVYTNYVGLQV